MNTSTRTKGIAVGAAVVGVFAASVAGPAIAIAVSSPAQAAEFTDKAPIAVSLGDSFISGEGGRFNGNVYTSLTSDGARDTGPHNKGWDSYRDQFGRAAKGKSELCHRSDSAEIYSLANANGWKAVNLACSGATSTNILMNGQHGEDSQLHQLDVLAADPKNDIKAVAVSIGGNDLGFSSLIADCTQVMKYHNCGTDGTWPKYEARGKQVKLNITNTLDGISSVMRSHGYADGSYKFVYQSAVDIFATSDHRYKAANFFNGHYEESPGVPLSDATVDFAHKTILPWLTNVMRDGKNAASNKSIQFMNLSNAFAGHEMSNKATKQITFRKYGKTETPKAENAEWVVAINSNFVAGSLADTQRQQESYHPNAFGQQAFGKCLVETVKSGASETSCLGHAGQGPLAVTVTPVR